MKNDYLGQLSHKREKVKALLKKENIEFDSNSDVSILMAGYALFGRRYKKTRTPGLSAMHGMYSGILHWSKEPKVEKKKKRKKREKIRKSNSLFSKEINEKIDKFYRSLEWRKLRYEILVKHGAKCLCCGRGRQDGIVIHVDHIKPLRKNWHLRLDANNLQVLCDECNHGKANWDETDWRKGGLCPD